MLDYTAGGIPNTSTPHLASSLLMLFHYDVADLLENILIVP